MIIAIITDMKGIGLIVILLALLIAAYLVIKNTQASTAAAGTTMVDMPAKAEEQVNQHMQKELERVRGLEQQMGSPSQGTGGE